jgi:hypothetical protein
MEISNKMVEKAERARFEYHAYSDEAVASRRRGDEYDDALTNNAMRAALEAVAPLIAAQAIEDQRRSLRDPQRADWYWRDLDPDDCGYCVNDAITMMGEGVVCHVRSSFIGPDFFAAIVPVLDKESDDTEELIAETAEECARLVQERYAAIRAAKETA